jgi:hypothetical protein
MANKRILGSLLLAAGILMMSACSTQPKGALLDKKFERAAKHYEQYQYQGQKVYCKKAGTRSMPMACLTEAQLRQEVENYERRRNPMPPTLVAGAGQSGIGG